MRRSLVLVSLLATGCSKLLGFDDFSPGDGSGSGSGSGSDDADITIDAPPGTIALTGHVVARDGTAVVGILVDMADRNGQDLHAEAVTDGEGNFTVFAPVPQVTVDGYLHLSSPSYLETYVHLPGPTSQALSFDVLMLRPGDLVQIRNEAGVAPVASTGTMIVDAGASGRMVEYDPSASGVIRYFDASGAVSPTATSTSAQGRAIALNLPDDFYYPRIVGTVNPRGYSIGPDTVAQVIVAP